MGAKAESWLSSLSKAFPSTERSGPDRIYIVPNWLGLAYATGLLALFAWGTLAKNPLLTLMGFALFTFFLVGLFQTNNNLRGIGTGEARSDPGPVGGQIEAEVTLFNHSDEPRFALEISFDGAQASSVQVPVMSAAGATIVKLPLPTHRRGVFSFPRIKIRSVFPLGLFVAWKFHRIEGEFAVFPQPLGARDLSTCEDGGRESAANHQAFPLKMQGDEFSGHRPFQPGDSLRQVDWKARARGLPLLVKEFERSSRDVRVLDWYDLKDLDGEARLSQLSRWVHQCHWRCEIYSLRLPGGAVNAGAGKRHFTKCLYELARSPAGSSE